MYFPMLPDEAIHVVNLPIIHGSLVCGVPPTVSEKNLYAAMYFLNSAEVVVPPDVPVAVW